MNNQQLIVEMLHETQNFEHEDEGYQRYKRREAFEYFLYSEQGLEFCSCGPEEAGLEEVVKVLEYCAQNALQSRRAYLLSAFGVSETSHNPLVQILFYFLTSKGFIGHGDEADVNDSELTPLGRVLLPMLREYIGW